MINLRRRYINNLLKVGDYVHLIGSPDVLYLVKNIDKSRHYILIYDFMTNSTIWERYEYIDFIVTRYCVVNITEYE